MAGFVGDQLQQYQPQAAVAEDPAAAASAAVARGAAETLAMRCMAVVVAVSKMLEVTHFRSYLDMSIYIRYI